MLMYTDKTIDRFVAELETLGVTEDKLKELMALSDKSWLQKPVADWLALPKAGVLKWVTPVTKSYQDAKGIMGPNFLGIEEVEQAFGVKYSEGDRTKLAQIPFDEKILRTCKDTHLLISGFPMSINDVRKKVSGKATQLFHRALGDAWFECEQFAQITVGVRWFLLRKESVKNSTSKTYNEQKRLIPLGEEIPFARDVVFATIALFLTTGEHLFEKVFVSCRDLHSRGERVRVGDFSRDGIHISSYWDERCYDYVSVCSVRNL
jgi:hypothetical protein